jgi:hypothetical protein
MRGRPATKRVVHGTAPRRHRRYAEHTVLLTLYVRQMGYRYSLYFRRVSVRTPGR